MLALVLMSTSKVRAGRGRSPGGGTGIAASGRCSARHALVRPAARGTLLLPRAEVPIGAERLPRLAVRAEFVPAGEKAAEHDGEQEACRDSEPETIVAPEEPLFCRVPLPLVFLLLLVTRLLDS